MMKKIYLLVALLLMSCQLNIRPDTFTRSGSEGIIVNFLPDAPPQQVFPESQFTIGFSFENKGLTDVSRLSYVLSFDEEFIQIEKKPAIVGRLKGRSRYSAVGDKVIRSITATALPLLAQSQNVEASTRITWCYPYKTEAFATVCVDSDPLSLRKNNQACMPGVQGLSASQGAPVAVRQVQAAMIPHEEGVLPQFVISVANIGGGQVFSHQRVNEACSSKPLSTEELNTVQLRAYLGEEELVCTPFILHLGLESSTRCQTSDVLEKSASFTSPLRIVLEYGYTQTISKDIRISR